ncbi:sigma 54-interacting transcriptional regulator [Salsuginibacillus halophilus]|uniref:sigma 54-interacting transcriptional regulator n=1 Tax=Salsuginibacillus halophilus TaxID=517424 RepID=UPI000D0DD727|nr:sigma 54-interacting transcriptional regulator [Salsuginibacillus halophilus]
MKKTIIIGAGRGGQALLEQLEKSGRFNVVGVADADLNAPGMMQAEARGIETAKDYVSLIQKVLPDVVIEATGASEVSQRAGEVLPEGAALIPASVASVMYALIEEKEELLKQQQAHDRFRETILQSTHDGMIAINQNEQIILYNRQAELITGVTNEQALGAWIYDILPQSKLPDVLKHQHIEANQQQTFANGRNIVTTRVPLWRGEEMLGALAVFQDVTDVQNMAEEVTNLKSIQQMLEAIIQSSEEAISVVDENGNGLLINPAYTRLTGLTADEVVGQPATADISEGESMHFAVLRTEQPVRGARMKVGPNRKDVLVNAAPILVDGTLKGSVGVIQDVSEIRALTEELERARQIIRTLEAKYTFSDIIGQSEEMQVAVNQAQAAAATPVNVMLRGESGTGKELFAHAIHDASKRKYRPFIRVNCAALSESLLESELFGYEEGAFSGAKRGGKRGLFEEAHEGSLFLDEIGEMSASTQAKLLRVLQEKEIVRVGGTASIPVDVRVIAATNVQLELAIHDGSFREDLYYRLNKLPIQIPPLAERLEDLNELCQHLLYKINQEYGRNVQQLSAGALQELKQYHWPGNVRELENVLGRAVIHMPFHATEIVPEHLPPLTKSEEPKPSVEKYSGSLQERLDAFERQQLLEALAMFEGNKTKAAEHLKISIRNLYYKLEKHGYAKTSMQ